MFRFVHWNTSDEIFFPSTCRLSPYIPSLTRLIFHTRFVLCDCRQQPFLVRLSKLSKHGGAVGSIAFSQLQGPSFDPELGLLSVQSFATTFRVSTEFSGFLSMSKNRLRSAKGYAKLPSGVKVCVHNSL